MVSASLAPINSSSNIIGQTDATIVMSFTPTNEIPTSGYISVVFPDMEVTADETFNSASGAICVGDGVSYLSTSTCTYNSTTNTLTIINIVSGPTSASGTITISYFKNPISASGRSGYQIRTHAADGGRINVFSMSLTVSTAASFSTLGITNSPKTVDTASVFTILWKLSFPVLINCYIQIDFPSDLSVPTSTLTSFYDTLSGQIVSDTPSSSFVTKNTTTVIVRGSNSNIVASDEQYLNLDSVINPKLVKATSFFTITIKDSSN